MKSSIMIIGGAGYIGTELIRSLELKHDIHITVVDQCWFGNHLPDSDEITLRKMDAWKLSPSDVKGYEAVLFLAGLANDQMCEFSPIQNFTDNAALPSYLGYICKQAGVSRFIYASSCAVYGDVIDRDASETDSTHPTHIYGIAKLQGEVALMNLADENFHVYCLRKGTVSGWSSRMRLDLVLNTMTRDAFVQDRIFVRGPDLCRPMISIKDIVSVYSSLLIYKGNRNIPSGIYNVAEGNYTIESLARSISEVFRRHNRKIEVQIEGPQNTRTCRMEFSRSRAFLPSIPKETPEDIVMGLYDRMYEIYKDNPANFSDARFYNVQVFRQLFGK